VFHAVQLQGEYATGGALFHGGQHAGAAGIIQLEAPVVPRIPGIHGCAIRHRQHHAQGHEGRTAGAIPVPRQGIGQGREAFGVQWRTRPPVITFDDEYRMAQHRLDPVTAQGRAPGPEQDTPGQQQGQSQRQNDLSPHTGHRNGWHG
jgi:hypothetical protein